jgi:glucan phosphoethanolaminetransferase (alkaline phosphatase superfamily)
LVLLIPNIESVKLYLLSIIIGMFLYVVFLIIIPETMDFKDKKDALYRFVTFIVSLVLISAMIYKFHNHGDEVNPQAATSGNVQSGHGGHGHGHGGHVHGHGCHH